MLCVAEIFSVLFDVILLELRSLTWCSLRHFMLWLCLILEVIKIWKDFASKFLWNMNCPCTSCKYWFYLGVCRWQGHFAQASIPPRLLMSSGLLQAASGLAHGFCFYPMVFLFKAEQMRHIRGTVEQGIYLSPFPGESNHCICSRTGIWCWCLLSPAFFILMAGSMSRAQHFPRQVIQLFAWRNLTLPQPV